MQTQFLILLFRIHLGMSGESHSTGQHQSAVKSSHPAVPGGLVESRTDIPGIAAKAEGHTLVLRIRDIQRTPRKYRETESRCVKHPPVSGKMSRVGA